MSISTKKKRKAKIRIRRKLHNKSEIQILTGTTIKYSIENPLDQDIAIVSAVLSHKNYNNNIGLLNEIERSMDTIIHHMDLKWRITITIEFCEPSGRQRNCISEIIFTGKLKDAHPYYVNNIDQTFEDENLDEYVNTHIKAEIIGKGKIKLTDFKIKLDEAV